MKTIFHIVTPSYNQLGHLRRCVASVADQGREGVGRWALGVGVKQALGVRRWASGKVSSESMIRVHHHIQDACSTDGTVEFLKEYQQVVSCQRSAVSQGVTETPKAECRTPNAYLFSFQSEQDDGMYDGINRGVERAIDGTRQQALGDEDMEVVARHEALGIGGESGIRHQALGTREALSKNTQHPTPNTQHPTPNPQHPAPNTHRPPPTAHRPPPTAQRPIPDSIVAWLNCDEQYLPGTLKKVSDFFLADPSVDILFGGMLMVDADGKLLACRKAMPMRKLFLEASYLYNFSCAMFFRRSAWEKLGGLDTSFKNAGDEELIRRALKLGLKTAVLDDYLATFTYSGENLSSDPASVKEHERLKHQNPKWVNLFRVPINLLRLGEKFLRGGFVQKTLVEYEIYVGDSPRRTKFRSENSSCRWPDEARPYLMSHRLK